MFSSQSATITVTGGGKMKIALTSIPVNDPISAFRFYTEVLGFVERLYVPEARLEIVVSPEEPDGTGLLLEPNDSPISKTWQEGVYNMGLPIIVFGVEDIQREFERLKALGVIFRGEPTKEDWGTQVVFEDTCGNLIQLHQA
jgi:predicted enzyme related to lactoylglutathione lyase